MQQRVCFSSALTMPRPDPCVFPVTLPLSRSEECALLHAVPLGNLCPSYRARGVLPRSRMPEHRHRVRGGR